eukprot:1520149-Rhodomonas_salina.6
MLSARKGVPGPVLLVFLETSRQATEGVHSAVLVETDSGLSRHCDGVWCEGTNGTEIGCGVQEKGTEMGCGAKTKH